MNAMKNQTETQKRVLICALLESFLQPCTVDAIQASRKVNEAYGINYDWHDYAEALDFLVRTGGARINVLARRIDGFTQYTLCGK